MKKDQVRPAGKSKMTVMMVQLEGDDQTVQEGIRTISQAMGNMISSARVLQAKPAAALATPEKSATDEEGGEALDTDGNGNGGGEGLVLEPQEERSARPAGKPRTPKVLNLDMKAAKIPLKEFCEMKQVGESDTTRYLVIAFWLKENLNIPAVTMDHVYTCYRLLNWQTPADASSPLRSMKKSGWFDKGTDKGSYSINHVGENQILEMGVAE